MLHISPISDKNEGRSNRKNLGQFVASGVILGHQQCHYLIEHLRATSYSTFIIRCVLYRKYSKYLLQMFLTPCVSGASVGRECNFTMISGTRKQISRLTYGIACMITSSAAVIKTLACGLANFCHQNFKTS